MNRVRRSGVTTWASTIGTRFLPFADAASDDLPLSRLLRLSLFQISVGMAMVMLVGTLNRVMIVEMGVPTTLVSFMVALPLLIAPFRALIGFQSDHHRSHLGWRRVPYIWMGTLMQFGGFSIMPTSCMTYIRPTTLGCLSWVDKSVASARPAVCVVCMPTPTKMKATAAPN